MSSDLPPGLRQHFGKKRYRTQAFAEQVAARCLAARGVELRAYYCGMCGGYHLTKQPRKTA